MSTALSELARLELNATRLPASNLHELMRVHEARHLLIVGKLVALGALERKESRGWHRRDDFPDEEQKLRGHFILKRDGDTGTPLKISSSFKAF